MFILSQIFFFTHLSTFLCESWRSLLSYNFYLLYITFRECWERMCWIILSLNVHLLGARADLAHPREMSYLAFMDSHGAESQLRFGPDDVWRFISVKCFCNDRKKKENPSKSFYLWVMESLAVWPVTYGSRVRTKGLLLSLTRKCLHKSLDYEKKNTFNSAEGYNTLLWWTQWALNIWNHSQMINYW